MTRAPFARSEVVILGVVLLAALALRTWGGFFGLPHVYHPDEGFEVYRAVRLGTGGFDLERTGKGGYYFLLFLEYGIYFLGQLVTGAVSGAEEFTRSFAQNPTPFWKIGRVTTAVLGTLTVALVWWQGRRMGSARAGLLGAAFLAFSFQHVSDSHFVTVDVPMTLFAFWAVVLVVEDLSGRSPLRVRTFAPVAAYAALCELPAFVLFVPFLVAAWLRGGLRAPGGVLSRRTMRPIAATVAIYCVLNPGVVLGFGRFAGSALSVFAPGVGVGVEPMGVEQSDNHWLFYARALLQSQGPALLALAGIGAAIGVARRSQGAILHLAFVAAFFVLIAVASGAHLFDPRHVIPMLPGICLLAALALDDLVARIQRAPVPGGLLAAAIALLVLVEPGLASMSWDRRLTRTDTRTRGAEWVEAHVEPRSRILLEGFPADEAQLAIPLYDTKKNVRDMIERLRATDPGRASYWEMKVDLVDAPRYDLVTVSRFEPWGTLADYLADGVQWVVLRREYFVAGERRSVTPDADVVESRQRFYVELVSHPGAERMAFFPASETGDPGFDIEIWRLAPEGPGQTLAGGEGAGREG